MVSYSRKFLFMTLIAIVGLGLIISLIRMGNQSPHLLPKNYASSFFSNEIDLDVGPTEFVKSPSEYVSEPPDEEFSEEFSEEFAEEFSEEFSEELSEEYETEEEEGEDEFTGELMTEEEPSVNTNEMPLIDEDDESAQPEQPSSRQTHEYNIDESAQPEQPSSRQTHVLLLTEGRSGSTWLSSFFWFKQDIFYVFEPLFFTQKLRSRGCHDSDETRKECDEEVLGHLWGCDFTSSELSVLGRYPHYRKNCDNNGCSDTALENYCRTSTHIVAKTILLFDLENLENLLRSDEYDIKVIQLVRDPRPLTKSRAGGMFGSLDGLHKHPPGGYTREEYASESKTMCERMLRMAQIGDNPPDWLKGRYTRISHEEMSIHPIETAKHLYEFVGLQWDQESYDYIYNTTIGAIGKSGGFGIGRVSTNVVNKWKTQMDDEKIELITTACKDTLEYLGYETDLEKIRNYTEEEGEDEEEEDGNTSESGYVESESESGYVENESENGNENEVEYEPETEGAY